MKDVGPSGRTETSQYDSVVGQGEVGASEKPRLARSGIAPSVLRSVGVGLLALTLFIAWYSEFLGCWSWDSIFWGFQPIDCPTNLPVTALVIALLAVSTLTLSLLTSVGMRHLLPRPPRTPGQGLARPGLVLIYVGFALFIVDIVLILPGAFGVFCTGPPCQFTVEMWVYDYAPTLLVVVALSLMGIGLWLHLTGFRRLQTSVSHIRVPQVQPKGATAIPVVTVGVILIIGGLAILVVYPMPFTACPTLRTENIMSVSGVALQAGLAHGVSYQFIPHSDHGECALSGSWPSIYGWVNFTAKQSSPSTGYAAMFTPSGWANATSGGNFSPLWCASQGDQGAVSVPINCTATNSTVVGGQPTGIYGFLDTTMVFSIWSQYNQTLQAHVTYNWFST